METKVLNYRVIVEKEPFRKGFVYVAYAPTLGLSDFGKNIEEAVANLEKEIKLYLEALVKLGKPIPASDSEEYFVTTRKVEVLAPAKKLAYF